MSNSIKWTNIQEELPPHDTCVVFVSFVKPDKARETGSCIDVFTGTLEYNGKLNVNTKVALSDCIGLFWMYQDDFVRNSDVLHSYCMDVYLVKETDEWEGN